MYGSQDTGDGHHEEGTSRITHGPAADGRPGTSSAVGALLSAALPPSVHGAVSPVHGAVSAVYGLPRGPGRSLPELSVSGGAASGGSGARGPAAGGDRGTGSPLSDAAAWGNPD